MEFCRGTSTECLFVHWFQVDLEFGVLVFVERGKPENPKKNPWEQGREPTTHSTHMWHQVWEMTPGHNG